MTDYSKTISYEGLWQMMEKRKLKKIDLRKYYGFPPNTIDRLIHNKNVSVETLMRLCDILACQPGNLVSYMPDKKE